MLTTQALLCRCAEDGKISVVSLSKDHSPSQVNTVSCAVFKCLIPAVLRTTVESKCNPFFFLGFLFSFLSNLASLFSG